jgi:hypothetical protein
MAKRKRRGRKGSRKHAMPRKVKSRRGRRGRRHSNPGAMGSVVLGGLGYLVAGGLGYLVNSYGNIVAANQQWVSVAVAAVGAAGTAMIPADPGITASLAAGMAANAGINLLRKGTDAAGVGLDAKKFMGLTSSPAAAAASSTAESLGVVGLAAIVPKDRLAVEWDATEQKFLKADGTYLPSAGVGVVEKGGTAAIIYTDPSSSIPVLLVDNGGNVWLPAAIGSSAPNKVPLASVGLSGTFPPWAGYPGYDKRGFPQQVVSLPAQLAPHVSGYANYAPAMNGYANYAPAMSGWDAGYGHM